MEVLLWATTGHFMPFPVTYRHAKHDDGRGLRLDGWKEIASYLCRGERTVKRWEHLWDLPIHRVPGAAHGRVFARTTELDEWLASRSAQVLNDAEENHDAEKDPAALHGNGEAVSSVGENPPLAATRTSPRMTSERWALAGSGLLLAGIALYAGIHFDLKSRSGELFSSPSATRASQPPGSSTVPQAEKRLAHGLCLKGRYEWNYRTADSLNRALDDFTQAIVHDPGSAQAYAGLADTYILLREYASMPENDAYARALTSARKAVALDDSCAEAHRALAFVMTWGNWNFVDGEKEFRRAIELNPSDPVVRRWFANAFSLPGNLHEALEQMDKAQELDPTSHATLADKGLLLYKAGRAGEGVELLKQVERTDPEFRSPHFYLMNISLVRRDYSNFLHEGEKTAQVENNAVLHNIIASAAAGYRRNGEKGLLQSLYAIQKKYYREGKLLGMILVRTCIAMGNRQEALAILEEECGRHSPGFVWCLSDPDLLTLKYQARYQQLVKNINLPMRPRDATPGPVHEGNPSTVRAAETSPF